MLGPGSGLGPWVGARGAPQQSSCTSWTLTDSVGFGNVRRIRSNGGRLLRSVLRGVSIRFSNDSEGRVDRRFPHIKPDPWH